MNALVTGSNGFIGSHLVEQLIQRRYEVSCLIRKTSNLRWIRDLPVRFIYGDITDFNSLIPAVKNMDYVFHLGGVVRAKKEQEFYQANYEGTKNLLRACQQKNPDLKKFIFVSSQAAIGPGFDKIPLNESDPPRPISIYGKSKLKAEQAVLDYRPYFPITIIRPPSVYGPRDDDILEIFKYVKLGIKPLLGMKSKYISLIHVTDLIEGIMLAAESEKSTGQIFFLANPQIYSILEFETAIADAMNKKAITIKVPEFLIDLVASMTELMAKITGKIAIMNKDKALEMKQRYWLVDSMKARNELSFLTKISLEEGIRETLLWYQQNRWL